MKHRIGTAAFVAACLLLPAAAHAAGAAGASTTLLPPPVAGGEFAFSGSEDKKEEKKDGGEKPKPVAREEWRAPSAKLANPWIMNVAIWVRNYVAFGTDASDRLGPFVTGVSTSFRMGGGYRFDFGVAWNGTSNIALYPAFRQFFLAGPVFSVWAIGGFIIPLEEETLNTGANLGIYAGPGFRWWLADGFGVYFEATPNYRFGLGLTIEAAVGVELGVF